jgi:hypothetical protein
MEKKSNLRTWLMIIVLLGILSSWVNSNFQLGRLFKGLEATQVEILLDYLNIGLAVIAFGFLFVFIIMWIVRKDKWKRLKSGQEEDQ